MTNNTYIELEQEVARLKRKIDALAGTVDVLQGASLLALLELQDKVTKAGVAISQAVVVANGIDAKLHKF